MVIERKVDFKRELSITVVRCRNGEVRFYPITENVHQNGTLLYSIAPAQVNSALEGEAQAMALKIVTSQHYVGALTIELFDTDEGLLINELAPRVHNSAHWTLKGAFTSQFENHLRAICGLPLGDTQSLGVTGMVNLLGNVPELGQLMDDRSQIYLYRKQERPNRKLGHVLCHDHQYPSIKQRVGKLLHAAYRSTPAVLQQAPV
jgi:5-(carboxyamino)imidazole ribonucleotide synthase